jgi:predicted RNase H-like HicB family nuclease
VAEWERKDLRGQEAYEKISRKKSLKRLRRLLASGVLGVDHVRSLREGRIEESTTSLDWLDDLTDADMPGPELREAPFTGAGRWRDVPGSPIDAVLDFGKHKGQRMTDIAFDDPTYLVWIKNNGDLIPILRKKAERCLAWAKGRKKPEPHHKGEPDESEWEKKDTAELAALAETIVAKTGATLGEAKSRVKDAIGALKETEATEDGKRKLDEAMKRFMASDKDTRARAPEAEEGTAFAYGNDEDDIPF